MAHPREHSEREDLCALAAIGTVEPRLDGLEITLPLIPAGRLWRVWLLVGLPILGMLGVGLVLAGSILWPALGLVVVLLIGLAVLGAVMQQAQFRMRLTAQHVEIGGRQFALEDVESVTFRTSVGLESRPGGLELTLPEETFTAQVVQPEAGPPLVRVVRQHVQLRRALLVAEGHDLSQPVKPPPALQTMQRRSRD